MRFLIIRGKLTFLAMVVVLLLETDKAEYWDM